MALLDDGAAVAAEEGEVVVEVVTAVVEDVAADRDAGAVVDVELR